MRANPESAAEGPPRIVVDDREQASGLAQAVATLWSPTVVGRLPVGDVEIGSCVLVERKTVVDFVASLEDGRLFRQATALAQASRRPLLMLEGEDGIDAGRIAPNALRGVLLSILVGFRLPLLRTGSTAETAISIAAIAKQEARRLARRRRQTAEPRTPLRASLDVLGTIPGVGDERARRLLRGLGSVRAVLSASEEEIEAVPGIGRTTARALREILGDPRPRAGNVPDEPDLE